VRGKYNFAAGNIDEALSELSLWTEHPNLDISVAALTWRAQLNRLLGDEFQADNDLSRVKSMPFVAPPERVNLLRPEKIEVFRKQGNGFNTQGDSAPDPPPPPIVDPHA
jgi:hypothetical protein